LRAVPWASLGQKNATDDNYSILLLSQTTLAYRITYPAASRTARNSEKHEPDNSRLGRANGLSPDGRSCHVAMGARRSEADRFISCSQFEYRGRKADAHAELGSIRSALGGSTDGKTRSQRPTTWQTSTRMAIRRRHRPSAAITGDGEVESVRRRAAAGFFTQSIGRSGDPTPWDWPAARRAASRT